MLLKGRSAFMNQNAFADILDQSLALEVFDGIGNKKKVQLYTKNVTDPFRYETTLFGFSSSYDALFGSTPS
jgi:hypothetical protein